MEGLDGALEKMNEKRLEFLDALQPDGQRGAGVAWACVGADGSVYQAVKRFNLKERFHGRVDM